MDTDEDRNGGHGAAEGRGPGLSFVLSQLGFVISRRFGELLVAFDLEPRHFALLQAINQGEARGQNAVADALEIPPSSFVALVDHLETKRLVERRTDPTDRRARSLYITEKGRSVLEAALERAWEFESTVSNGLEPDERRQVVNLLGRIRDNLGIRPDVHPGMQIDAKVLREPEGIGQDDSPASAAT